MSITHYDIFSLSAAKLSVGSPRGKGTLWKEYLCTPQKLYCRFTRMSFLPLLFQRRCLAYFHSESRGGVSHSDGHAVVAGKTKSRYTETSKSAGVLLSLQSDVLCIGFEFQRRDCLFICSLTDSTNKEQSADGGIFVSLPWAIGVFYFFIKTSCIQL